MPENDKEIPVPYEKPLILSEKQKWLCSHLDALNGIENFCPNAIPSDLFVGALSLVKSKNRKTNPDWMAQAAHSLREILYGVGQVRRPKNKLILAWQVFLGKGENSLTRRARIENLLKVYQEEQRASELAHVLNDLHFIFTNIAHHLQDSQKHKYVKKKLIKIGISNPEPSLIVTEAVFEQLMDTLENAWAQSIPRQLTIHEQIDSLLSRDPKLVSKGVLNVLLSFNPDARYYFYTKADERWLGWLWGNGFLDVIKQKAEDPTRYGYRTPEVNYLVKVSEKEPAKVVDIMLAVPISTENFNPEVVDRFLRICSGLPAPELKRMVKKIRDDGLVRLMGAFNDWGFEYEKMLKTLTDVNDFDSVLVLAEAVLSIRTKKEAEQTSRGFLSDNPFYFKELSYTKVFEYLLKVDEKNIENALTLVTSTMKEVVLFGEKEGKDEVFKVYDSYFLLDVDFFELELTEKDRLSHRDDVKNLAAVIKHYAEQTIGKKCDDVESAVKLYNQYFNHLPDSRSMWRLRLFVLSLCPGAFKEELKKAFFRLFEIERYYNEIISGTEYLKALRIGFPVLSDDDKRKYVKQVIDYFVKKDQEKENEKENWHIGYGSRIISVIADQLTEEEKQTAKDAGFTLDPNYKPEPSIKMGGFAGSIRPRGPIIQEEFGNLSITDIAGKLRVEWTPEELRKENTNEDFHNPLNAEGVGEMLRIDITKRLQDYINNANIFFERDKLDQHYTYSFLRGIQEVLRGNKTEVSGINWDNLIALCVTIKKSGETKPFDSGNRERDTFDAWLSGWTGVHSAMTDVVQELLTEERGAKIDFPKYRDDLFGVIGYLLSYPDPVPADEEPKTAKMTTTPPGAKEQMVSDPYSMAINTVRGRAFQAFALFMYQDGKKFSKNEKIKISLDVKGLYEAVLKKENTRALMFMFGHYLPSFYFRDKEWMQSLFSQIFSAEPTKKNLYTAAWEGYVSANLYDEIFFNPDTQKLYERGLALTDSDYPQQKHFKEPDEGVAVHVALAFMHFSKFDFDHDLFKKFWSMPNPEYHKEFISFIGRHSISRKSAAEWIKYNKVDIEKLKKFWDWALKNCNIDALTGFGFWINMERSPLDTKWLASHARQTLEKTKGYVEWEYGLMRSLAAFAKEAPEDTLAILRAHLLEEVAKHEPVRTWLHMDAEVYDTFKELYKNEATKEGVRTLVNDLLPYRNGMFWGLKSILEEK
ncbi:MAG: hypothetical protein HY093_03755 [Candidatus Liptonbacteria bacterium]|nr:hypothetical protein [Candidatus Liptonbacteria bacterium]